MNSEAGYRVQVTKKTAIRSRLKNLPCVLAGSFSLLASGMRQGFAIPSDTSGTSPICADIVWGSFDGEILDAF